MKKILFALLPVFALSLLAPAQKNKGQFEIMPYVRFDKYSAFSYNFIDRNSLSMKGISYGLSTNYKYAIANWVDLIGGIGYYRYSFNKLTNINSSFGEGHSRSIIFPSRAQPLYSTDAYYYHTVSLNIGFGKNFVLGKKNWLSSSVIGSNYFTFRQAYKIEETLTYKSSKTKSFAQSLIVKAGLLRQLGSIRIGPSLLVPVYNSWLKDEVFLENPSEKREKWLMGWGAGIDINLKL